jgi:hypothetical protein
MARQTGRGEDHASRGGEQRPEVDYVEAEHDPAASRRTSDTAIQRMLGPRIQRKAARATQPSTDTAGVQCAASDSGAPLPADVRGRFEASLGTDLSGVRVHTGSASATAADGVGAKAYTTGQDIHFAAGQYEPASTEGQRLLAHEVAHTVQQGNSYKTPQAKLEVSGPADSHEHEADRAADAMLVGAPASVSPVGASIVQRKSAAGTDTGVSAEDLVNAPNLGQIRPSKRNLVQTYDVGDEYVDNEAVCEGKDDSVPGCFLTDRKRDKVINKLFLFVQTALTNYKLALVELKIDELLKKEEDLSWVLSLALDLAGAHFAIVLARALQNVQKAGAKRIEELILHAGAAGNFNEKSWLARADRMVASVTPGRIETLAKFGMGAAGLGVKSTAKEGLNVATQTTKAATISYIDQLKDACDPAFMAFLNHVSVHTADAELVVVLEGMKPEYHSTSAYKESLGEKIARFRQSGVLDIGRKEANADNYGGKLMRDTRVVYVQDINRKKTPWYQRQEGKTSSGSGYIRPGDPLYDQIDGKNPKHQAAWSKFGPRGAGAATLDRPVPEEFRDVAIAASEARWGTTITIDDGYVATLKQQGINVEEMRMKLRGSRVLKSSSPADKTTGTPFDMSVSGAQLPAGSIFEEQEEPEAASLPPGSVFARNKS